MTESETSTLDTVRVLIADDDPWIRGVLGDIIRAEPGLDLVGEASGGNEAVALALTTMPDVVLIDVHMADGGGVEAVRKLVAATSPPRVVALSGYSDSGAVQEMLQAGAVGYLVKGTEIDAIIDAIWRAARGETALPS
jgi:DNA-binding NarL/FixJ family response regulator